MHVIHFLNRDYVVRPSHVEGWDILGVVALVALLFLVPGLSSRSRKERVIVYLCVALAVGLAIFRTVWHLFVMELH
jgi:hypothetical protein